MLIPEGYSENEVLDIIEKILSKIAKKYIFGIYSLDDIKQEGFIIAIKDILPEYDASLPLENFLRISLNHRLKNFKRNNYIRINRPCSKCKTFDPKCEKCCKRQQNQDVKKNLLNPIDIHIVVDDKQTMYEGSLMDTLEMVEILDKINKRLSVEYRQDYLKIKEGLYVPKSRKEEIEKIITEIIEDDN